MRRTAVLVMMLLLGSPWIAASAGADDDCETIDTTGVGRHEKITVLDEVPIDDPVPIRKAPGVFRNCLSCRQEFRSAGPGNRVCERCKDGDAWKTRATIYSIGHYRKG